MPVLEFVHDRRQIIGPIAILPPAASDCPNSMEKVRGLIDTGASMSGIRSSIAETLSLPRRGKTIIATPSGDHVARLFQFRMGFFIGREDSYPYVIDREFIGIGCSPGSEFDALIGMDVIGRGDLAILRSGSGSFTFDAAETR